MIVDSIYAYDTYVSFDRFSFDYLGVPIDSNVSINIEGKEVPSPLPTYHKFNLKEINIVYQIKNKFNASLGKLSTLTFVVKRT